MKTEKAMKECFSSLVKGETCYKKMLSDRKVLILPNPTKGFVFDIDNLFIDLEMVEDLTVDTADIFLETHEIILTDEAMIQKNGNILRKFKDKDGTFYVWVNNKLLNYFEGAYFYTDRPNKPITVKEFVAGKTELQTVGVVLPTIYCA